MTQRSDLYLSWEPRRCSGISGLVDTSRQPRLAALLERKPPKLVAVALANKFARIALAPDDVGRNLQSTI